MSLVAVFIPVLFLGGLIGRLFHEFAVTIGAAILVSGFVSLTLTPMLCSRFLRRRIPWHEQKSTRFSRRGSSPSPRGSTNARCSGYDRALQWVMAHSRLVFAFSAVILVATLYLAQIVPKGFIPTEDQGQLRATTETAEGTSFDGMYRHQVMAMNVVAKDSNVGGLHVVDRRGRQRQRPPTRAASSSGWPTARQRKLSADDVARELTAQAGAGAGAAGLRAEPAGDQYRRPLVQEPLSVHAAGRRHRPAVPDGAGDAGASWAT